MKYWPNSPAFDANITRVWPRSAATSSRPVRSNCFRRSRRPRSRSATRACANTTSSCGPFSAQIDATVETLDQTNKWLAEMDEFKDVAGDLPTTAMRIGYETLAPPVIPPQRLEVRARADVRVNQRE